MSQYIFDNAAAQAGRRFVSLETLYDPRIVRFLKDTVIGPAGAALRLAQGVGRSPAGTRSAWAQGASTS